MYRLVDNCVHSALQCLSVCQHTEAEMEKPWKKKRMRSFATERERERGKKMEAKGRRWWRGMEQRVNVRGRNGDRAGVRRKMGDRWW